jgi:hypothetical protein
MFCELRGSQLKGTGSRGTPRSQVGDNRGCLGYNLQIGSGADLTRAIRAYRALPPCAARGDIPPTQRTNVRFTPRKRTLPGSTRMSALSDCNGKVPCAVLAPVRSQLGSVLTRTAARNSAGPSITSDVAAISCVNLESLFAFYCSPVPAFRLLPCNAPAIPTR